MGDPAGGCAGDAVGGFRYRALRVRRGGAKARGVSRSSTAAAGASYAVVVSGPDGAVACGELERKGAKKKQRDDESAEDGFGDGGGDDSAADDGAADDPGDAAL